MLNYVVHQKPDGGLQSRRKTADDTRLAGDYSEYDARKITYRSLQTERQRMPAVYLAMFSNKTLIFDTCI